MKIKGLLIVFAPALLMLIFSGCGQNKKPAVTEANGGIGKALIWNGILMMMEMNMGSVASRQEATSVKTNIPVDGKYFQIPANITFSEIPGF